MRLTESLLFDLLITDLAKNVENLAMKIAITLMFHFKKNLIANFLYNLKCKLKDLGINFGASYTFMIL